MFLWRNLSPKSILDCIDYLVSTRENERADNNRVSETGRYGDARGESDDIDRATAEVQSRL